MKNNSNTPFDEKLQSDRAQRRQPPTHDRVRIGGPDAPPPTSAPANAPAAPYRSKSQVPGFVWASMGLVAGVFLVIFGSTLGRRLLSIRTPSAEPRSAVPGSKGEVTLPSTVIAEPTPTGAIEATPTPSVSVAVSSAPNGIAAEAYRGNGFSVAPPLGLTLQSSGRRTRWQHTDGTQFVVESTPETRLSPQGLWEKSDADFKKKYGERYRLIEFRETQVAGHPAAIWEFELQNEDGQTTRKMDVGFKANGRAYALLGAAPAERFDEWRPAFEQAVNSFAASDRFKAATIGPSKTPAKPGSERATPTLEGPIPAPEGEDAAPGSVVPAPEATGGTASQLPKDSPRDEIPKPEKDAPISKPERGY